ncbi:unnamed protein product [Rotaria sp. Silwood2]|nr:unnamed protein product [Rotaria sp. Silwood2]
MCRCTQTSIPYSQFVSLNSQFHQVCSSDFVSEEWFSSLFNANTSNYYPLDFRLMASAQFQVLSVLCRTSRQAVIDAVHGFAATTILSPNAMSRDVLNSYVGTSIEQFQKNTLDSFGSYYHFVSSFIEEHRFISALRTNFYTRSVPGTNISVTFSAIYPQQVDLTRSSFMSNETCLCDRTSDCVYPAGIYNQSRAIIPNEVFSLDASPLFIVPGFQVGCVPQNALLQSTLECFYNQSCLDIVISLTGALRTVSALNISNPFSRFSPTTTIGVLFDNIMIESWENSTDFATYFQTCAPKACSYSYVQRFFLIYMITTMASVFGGLSVVFRTMSPLFVKFILCLCRQRVQMLETNEGHEPKRNFQDRIWNSVKLIYHKTTTLNLFKTTFTNVQHGVYATRVYSILLMLGIYILTIYSSSTVRPQQIIVRNPSLDQFEHLYDMYSSKLSCPCRYSSIIRSTFISNEVQIHPFCTSSFVRDDRWFQYWTMKFLNGSIDPTPPFYWTDFRKNGLRFFNYVKIFCDIANINIPLRWRMIITYVRDGIYRMNVYQRKPQVEYQNLTTRIYIVLLVLSFVIVSVFVRFQHQTVWISVDSPNETYFSFLHNHYSDSLSCACTNIAIPCFKFSSFSSTLQGDCSQIMLQTYFVTLPLPGNIFWEEYDWKRIQLQMRTLYHRCLIGMQSSFQVLSTFTDTRLISIEAMTSETLDVWLNLSITWIDKSSVISSDKAYKFVTDMLQANQFHNRYMTSWKTEFSNLAENYILRNSPVSLNNGTCFCPSGESNCTKIPIYYDSTSNSNVFPGIVVGCSIMSGLSHSTFECFYDDVCINQLNRAFGISFTKFNLNETQFLPTTPIGSILDEYSVVSVNYSANYSAYFQICAPSICQYHYIEQRNVVYIFTTLLGLYGGLTAGLHIFVWYLVDLYRVVFNRCSRLLQRVHPSF